MLRASDLRLRCRVVAARLSTADRVEDTTTTERGKVLEES